MVVIYCAEGGSTFPVDIDENKSVADLKRAIAYEMKYSGRHYKLQLFLAKKNEGHGPWLTEAETQNGVSDTTGLKLLNAMREEICDAGLSTNDVRLQVTKQDIAELRGPVNVLVPKAEKWKKQPELDGSTKRNGSYVSFLQGFVSLLLPLEKVHSTKKDV